MRDRRRAAFAWGWGLPRRPFAWLLTLVGVWTAAGVQAADAEGLPDKQHFHLFLLAGQSNMAGRGVVEEQDRVVHPRVFTLSKDNTWVPAVDPIHFDKSVAGVCLGRTFGIALAEANPEISVGLIPSAAGGSAISSWQPGGYHSQTKSHPYDDALARTRLAMQRGTLKGILWHQGESDSNAKRAGAYAENLEALIARFRRELEAPDVPFLIGQLGIFAERPWNDDRREVDAAQHSVAESVPNTAFVTSEGLTPNPDLVHFDAASLRVFGKRYADAYQRLTALSATDQER